MNKTECIIADHQKEHSLNNASDNTIMLQVQSGRIELLGVLYERYKKWLYNFFYKMNYDADLSEDLVQNVFERILKYKHTYTGESKFVTWIFQIARNENFDHYRKNQKQMNDVSLDEVSYFLADQENAEETIERKEEVHQLRSAINSLPYKKKEIITLSKLKDLRYKEIGEIMGCSEANARIQSHRALQELKATFQNIQNT